MNQRPPGHRRASSHWMSMARRLACLSALSCPTTHSSMAPPATKDSTCLAQLYTCRHLCWWLRSVVGLGRFVYLK